MSYTSKYSSSYGSSASRLEQPTPRRDSAALKSFEYKYAVPRRDSTSRYGTDSYSSYSSPSRIGKYTSPYTSSYSRYGMSSYARDRMSDIETETHSPREKEVEEHEKDVPEPEQEVLQESDVDEFKQEQHNEEPEVRELDYSIEKEEEPEPEPEPEVEEVVEEEIAPPVEETRIVSPVQPEAPAYDNHSNENVSPSPVKKITNSVWPPRDEDKTLPSENDAKTIANKKRVSDLIARFNSGNLEDGKDNEKSYKSEYGAGKNIGKVHSNVFQ